MSRPCKLLKSISCDTFNFHIIEGQVAFDVSCTLSTFEIRTAEIRGIPIQAEPQLGPSVGLSELDVNVVAVNGLFEELMCPFGPQGDFYWMLPFTQTVNQTLTSRGSGDGGGAED